MKQTDKQQHSSSETGGSSVTTTTDSYSSESTPSAEISNRGCLVVVDGYDYTGKTTAVQGVQRQLAQETGGNWYFTLEPVNRELYSFVHQPGLDSLTQFFTFLADRTEHCRHLARGLAEGRNYICDRWSLATYAYQYDWARTTWGQKAMQEAEASVKPDAYVLVAVHPDIIRHRALTRDGIDLAVTNQEINDIQARFTERLGQLKTAGERTYILDGSAAIADMQRQLAGLCRSVREDITTLGTARPGDIARKLDSSPEFIESVIADETPGKGKTAAGNTGD